MYACMSLYLYLSLSIYIYICCVVLWVQHLQRFLERPRKILERAADESAQKDRCEAIFRAD